MPFTIATVCVNYLDFLEPAYEQNKLALSDHYYWVITSSEDLKTQEFCKNNNINCYVTLYYLLYTSWSQISLLPWHIAVVYLRLSTFRRTKLSNFGFSSEFYTSSILPIQVRSGVLTATRPRSIVL